MSERLAPIEQNPPQEPRAFLAKDVDFSELAQKTWGELYQTEEGETLIEWGGSQMRWDKKQDGSGRTLVMQEKLVDQHDCENYGFVMGQDFGALIYPGGEESVVGGELFFHGYVRYFVGPSEMFHPAFSQAVRLAKENLKKQRELPGGVDVSDTTVVAGGGEEENIIVGGDELLKSKYRAIEDPQ